MNDSALDRLRRSADVADRDFDRIFPDWAQELSPIHFTPVKVAVLAAAWLAAGRGARVLDVGAGAGKLCLVGALTTRGVFTGAELRPELAALAGEVARRHAVERCSFVAGDALALDWRGFDGLYLYNPFGERLPDRPFIDESLPRTPEAFRDAVAATEAQLSAMPAGARLATYHGFGGLVPAGWDVVRAVRIGDGSLICWMKTTG